MNHFFIETYGCQMNVAESNAIEALLLSCGWAVAERPEDADLAIINTCSVRKSAENRIWGRLGAYKRMKADKAKTGSKMVLVLTGCMADRIANELKKTAPHIDYIIGNNDKLKILEIATTATKAGTSKSSPSSQQTSAENPKYTFTKAYYKAGDFASYVPIMNGCNNFCSYCIVPYVRGREISRSPQQILDEVAFLDSQGVKEITLLGQNVNSYSYNSLDFPDLLKMVAQKCHNIQWIRFESPHPKDFSQKLIDVIATEDRVAKHLHIPMQSGNTRILGLMNRRYTREQYLDLVHQISSRIPEMTYAVDVMVGFPGESEAEFLDTISAMAEVGYIEAYMYYWNAREGTRACSMEGQIPEPERQQRLQRLIDWQLQNAARIKSQRAHGIQQVLVTQISRDNPGQLLGRNQHCEMVAFDLAPGANVNIGEMVNVEFLSLKGNTYKGRQVL